MYTGIVITCLHVCRRQIMTSKVDPRTVRVQIFMMAVDSNHRYSNESERANYTTYDDFKLKKPLWSPWFRTKYFSALRVDISVRPALADGIYCRIAGFYKKVMIY